MHLAFSALSLVIASTMGYEANLKAEDGNNRRTNRQRIIIAVLATLIFNGLAFYGFQNISKSETYDEIVREGALQEGNKMQTSIIEEQNIISARLNDALEEIRELRRENRKARDQLVKAQEGHLKRLNDIESNTRAIIDAQSDEDRENALEALKESITKDPYHNWLFDRRESLPVEFREYVSPKKLPFGYTSSLKSDSLIASVGIGCVTHIEALTQFMDYEVGKLCPDDGNLAQELLLGGCEPLPRRR